MACVSSGEASAKRISTGSVYFSRASQLTAKGASRALYGKSVNENLMQEVSRLGRGQLSWLRSSGFKQRS